jgi:hypothetical protein
MLFYLDGRVDDISPPIFVGQEIVIDVTEIARNWANGVFENHGLYLSSADVTFPFATSFDFFTFESATDPISPPRLTVTVD